MAERAANEAPLPLINARCYRSCLIQNEATFPLSSFQASLEFSSHLPLIYRVLIVHARYLQEEERSDITNQVDLIELEIARHHACSMFLGEASIQNAI